jgi:hypothetical protein
MADPDAPFTARTFGEAIELERRWKVKFAEMNARAEKLKVQRQARLAPLKALVDASVVEAKVLSRNEYQAIKDPTFYQRQYNVDKSPAFITKIRVRNLSGERVVAMKGWLRANDAKAELPMDLCWIDLQQELAPGENLEFHCGHDHRQASAQDQAFADNVSDRFEVVWEPRYVKLADGRELDSGR